MNEKTLEAICVNVDRQVDSAAVFEMGSIVRSVLSKYDIPENEKIVHQEFVENYIPLASSRKEEFDRAVDDYKTNMSRITFNKGRIALWGFYGLVGLAFGPVGAAAGVGVSTLLAWTYESSKVNNELVRCKSVLQEKSDIITAQYDGHKKELIENVFGKDF